MRTRGPRIAINRLLQKNGEKRQAPSYSPSQKPLNILLALPEVVNLHKPGRASNGNNEILGRLQPWRTAVEERVPNSRPLTGKLQPVSDRTAGNSNHFSVLIVGSSFRICKQKGNTVLV